MKWLPLTDPSGLDRIRSLSAQKPQLIFKHSTRCSISVMAKSRLERGPVSDNIDYHYLDLLNYREISNKIAEDFSVHHESPQVLLIVNGECIYEESHNGIDAEDIVREGFRIKG